MEIIIHGDVIINGPINYNQQPVEDPTPCCGAACTDEDETPFWEVEEDFGDGDDNLDDEDLDDDDFDDEEEPEVFTCQFSDDLMEEMAILDSINEAEGDFLFDAQTGTTEVNSWSVFGDGDYVANLGIKNLRMYTLEKYNKRIDIAITKDVAIALRDFLNGLNLGDTVTKQGYPFD